MPPEKPSRNKKDAARHSSDQQPSLLDQLELDEEQAPEKQALEKHLPEEPGQESSGHEDGDGRRAEEAGARTEDSRPTEEEKQPEPPSGQPPEPLKKPTPVTSRSLMTPTTRPSPMKSARRRSRRPPEPTASG